MTRKVLYYWSLKVKLSWYQEFSVWEKSHALGQRDPASAQRTVFLLLSCLCVGTTLPKVTQPFHVLSKSPSVWEASRMHEWLWLAQVLSIDLLSSRSHSLPCQNT